MDERVAQPRHPSFDHDTLVCFHIAHGSVLILEPAFEAALAAAKKSRAGVKACIPVAKDSSQKIHSQGEIVAVVCRGPE